MAMDDPTGGMGGQDMFLQYVRGLPQEELEKYLAPYDEQQAILQEQLEQAKALRRSKADGMRTPLGAALGGASDVMDTVFAALKEKKAREEQQALLKAKQTEGANRLADYSQWSQWATDPAATQSNALSEALRQYGAAPQAPAGYSGIPNWMVSGG
jgi:hypothetical protein